jgi:microcystin-dependent protein
MLLATWGRFFGRIVAAASLGAVGLATAIPPAGAITLPYISEIILTGADYCPADYFLPADGRALPIDDYDALFTLLGFTYGGDGTTTFNVPMVDPIRSASGQTLLPCIAVAGIFPPRN